MSEGAGKLAGKIHDDLADLVREILDRKPGGHLVESTLQEVELHLAVSLGEEKDSPAVFSDSLIRRIDQILDDAIQHAAMFRPGRTFCHRCGGPECEHAVPPSPRHVFTAYGPTGTPVWKDLAQQCLEEHHDEVDRLYDEPPAFLTLVRNPQELRKDLLEPFRARGYLLHGQVTAGFYTVGSGATSGRRVLALTFQIASAAGSGGTKRYGLNILGRTPEEGHLPWRRAVRWAQSALSTLGRRRGENLEARIEGILHGLARRLRQDHRSRGRRTRHAEQRHGSGERPTRKALEDLAEAAASDIFMDERNGTLVILGERGRTHFFNTEGKLVSSVRYSRDAIEGKLKNGLWRQATAPEIEAVRSDP